jgi:hypothetical protein
LSLWLSGARRLVPFPNASMSGNEFAPLARLLLSLSPRAGAHGLPRRRARGRRYPSLGFLYPRFRVEALASIHPYCTVPCPPSASLLPAPLPPWSSGHRVVGLSGRQSFPLCSYCLARSPLHRCVHIRCRVQGLGLRAQSSGLRAQGSGFRVKGLGLRDQGLGFRAQGLGLRV